MANKGDKKETKNESPPLCEGSTVNDSDTSQIFRRIEIRRGGSRREKLAYRITVNVSVRRIIRRMTFSMCNREKEKGVDLRISHACVCTHDGQQFSRLKTVRRY